MSHELDRLEHSLSFERSRHEVHVHYLDHTNSNANGLGPRACHSTSICILYVESLVEVQVVGSTSERSRVVLVTAHLDTPAAVGLHEVDGALVPLVQKRPPRQPLSTQPDIPDTVPVRICMHKSNALRARIAA